MRGAVLGDTNAHGTKAVSIPELVQSVFNVTLSSALDHIELCLRHMQPILSPLL